MKHEKIKPLFDPLLTALRQVNSRLVREGCIQLVVATADVDRKQIPEHVSLIPKKRIGKRKTFRGRRNYREGRARLAIWPEDAQDENPTPSIAYVLNGQADFHFADYIWRCQAGDCVIIPPGVPKQDGSKSHFEGDPTDRFCELLWFAPGYAQLSGLSSWICRSEGPLHITPENSSCHIKHRFLIQLFDGFCAEAMTTRRPQIMQQLFSLILLFIQSEIDNGNALEDWGRPRYHATNQFSSPITEALAFIEEHLDEHLTIEKVARHVTLAPATFTRHFKRETGQTFVEYQTQHRLKVAENLLLTTDFSISHICEWVGLKSGQLWALFQKTHGCSPSEFRTKQKVIR